MCCLFTWLAWCFDASHRLVVFIMACLISSSVCCLLLTASLAGVAMGYNYSLAEYIDLKETNISVYIKRGVYDDEIADDFDWRRSGGGDASIQLKDHSGLSTGAPEGLQPLASGRRRSDNSVFESDEQNKYEGGLMRLTSTQAGQEIRRFEPPAPPYTTSVKPTPNLVDGLLAVADNLPGGSLERLKAIQAAARHHEAKKIELATAKFPDNPSGRIKAIEENAQIHNIRRSDQITTTDKYDKYFGQLAQHPGFPGSGLSARKFMESNTKDVAETNPPNRFRDAVFRGELSGWPVSVASKSTTENFFEYEASYLPSMPTPPTVKPVLVRPQEGVKPVINWDLKKYPGSPRRSNDASRKKTGNIPITGRVYNDYDEAHGLPMRKKRSDSQVSAKNKIFDRISLYGTKIRASQNELHSGTPNAETEFSTNSEASLPCAITQSAKKLPTEEQNRFDNIRSKSSKIYKESIGRYTGKSSSISDIQPENNDLEHLTISGKMKKEVTNRKARKHMDSKGYEYKMRGNKQTKSIWWRISDEAQERWHRIIMYLGKHISPKSDNFQSNKTSHNQSSFLNKLFTIPTKKVVDANKLYRTVSNIKRNLEVSTVLDHGTVS